MSNSLSEKTAQVRTHDFDLKDTLHTIPSHFYYVLSAMFMQMAIKKKKKSSYCESLSICGDLHKDCFTSMTKASPVLHRKIQTLERLMTTQTTSHCQFSSRFISTFPLFHS